jgi:hypothetical protein
MAVAEPPLDAYRVAESTPSGYQGWLGYSHGAKVVVLATPLGTSATPIRSNGGGLATPKVPRVVAEPLLGAPCSHPHFFFLKKYFV